MFPLSPPSPDELEMTFRRALAHRQTATEEQARLGRALAHMANAALACGALLHHCATLHHELRLDARAADRPDRRVLLLPAAEAIRSAHDALTAHARSNGTAPDAWVQDALANATRKLESVLTDGVDTIEDWTLQLRRDVARAIGAAERDRMAFPEAAADTIAGALAVLALAELLVQRT